MAVNETLSAYSTTAADNTPAGSDSIGPDLDNHLRDIKRNIKNAAENRRGASTPEVIEGSLWADTSESASSILRLHLADTSGFMTLFAMDVSSNQIVSANIATSAIPASSVDLNQNTSSISRDVIDITASSIARAKIDGLGSAAIEDVGTSAGELLELITGSATSTAALPALSGENLTNLAITQSFTSSDQTITSAGQLILAHGLGTIPLIVQHFLVNGTGEHGYSAGDVVQIGNFGDDFDRNRGMSVVVDATNITIRFGSLAQVFNVIDKDDGTIATATNASWSLRVRAFA